MAMQTSPTSSPPTAQMVGHAFVDQYYHILHQSPDLVHRFYTDSSVLSRPGPDGNMVSVKTMHAINEVILSLDYKDYRAEINTIDAQESFQEGVVVLVTGWLTVKDDVKRKFTQSFFLAPQEKGYFVLNDVFRYVDTISVETNTILSVEDITESVPSAPATSAPVTPDPEPAEIPDHPVPENTAPVVEVVYGNGDVVHEATDNGEVSAVEVPIVEASVHPAKKEALPVTEPASTVQEDTPKKSYASILLVNKGIKVTSPVYVPTGKVAAVTAKKVVAGNAEQHSAPEASAHSTNNGPNSSNIPEEVEGHSVYIRNLPLNATVPQVEEEFKKFGAIRPNGIQVRSNKGFCFGFVEFVALDSKQSALEASPITIGGKQAHVEEKRTTTRVGPSGRPRFPPGRNTFRNDSFRSRGNFGGGSGGGGRGYGRNDYGNRGDFSGNRGDFSGRRGPSPRSGDGYQRVENGRVRSDGGISQTALTA